MIFKKTTQKIILSALLTLVLVGVFGFFGVVLAQDRFGLDTATGVGLPQNDLKVAIVNVIRYILGFLGIVAVLIIMYGGFLWMTAGGDPNKIDKAKKTLISAVIGLIIILSAFIIATFVINSLRVALCEGEDCATASCPNPPCTPICDNPPCSPGTANQYTFINKFKDNTIPWTRTVGSGFGGVVGMPASATLEVGAYAKNRGGTINGLELFTAPLADPFVAQSSFASVPTDQEIVSDVYAIWNSLAYVISDQFKAKISALFSGGRTVESREVKTIIRPTHCFNNIQDQGETRVDCGGDPEVLGDDYCGACDGGACEIDSDCASGVCSADGTCALSPIIDYISPATDPNDDTNFNVASTLDDDVGNGAPGNFITIWGRNFGAEPGEITFTDESGNSTIISLDLPAVCANTDNWQTYQIVVQIPELGTGDYQVNVYADSGLGSNDRAFIVNEVERPGICDAQPNNGVYPATTNILGNNFPTSGTQNVIWYLRPDNVASVASNWTATQVTDTFPENKKGQSSIRVYNGVEYSNYFKVLISAGGLGDPCGYDSYACATDTVSCQTGLTCEADSCTCQVSTEPVCEPNTTEACDNDGCVGNQTCSVDGSAWGACVQNDPACVPGVGSNPASQAVYTWAFSTFFGGLWPAPEVVEDCSRTFDCRSGQRLPSPTPWSEGWTTDHPGVTNAQACINTVISARFTTQMAPNTLNSDNIKVFECTGKNSNCVTPVGGVISVKDDNSGKTDDYFEFSPGSNLSAGKWYKVVLKKGIRSYVNVPIKPASDGLLAERGCNVATDAYCWNFETRPAGDPNLICPDGCVECSPDPNPGNTMLWYNANLDYSANLDSADNVCLTLKPDNNWSWRSDKTTNLSLIEPAVSTDENIGTAKAETIYDSPNPYASVFAQRPNGNQDFCRTTIDFTNPIVIENSTCHNGTTQSPSPWILSEDACLNALVSARFSRTMVDTTVENKDNIILQNCGVGETGKTKAQNDNVNECGSNLITNSDDIHIFDYSHQVTNDELIDIISEGQNAQGPLPEGFVVSRNSNLDSNNWYRVIILGGQGGVRGSRVETSVTQDVATGKQIVTKEEIEEPQGILLTPTINDPIFDYNGDGKGDYVWIFKTGSQVCDIDTVNVSPAQKFMRFVGETQAYNAFPQASNCNILNPCLYNWSWKSLINLDDDPTKNSGNPIAIINNFFSQQGICSWKNGDTPDTVNVDPTQTATAKGDGETNIVAKEPGGKSGYGHLQVGYGGLTVIKYSPQKTVHFENKNINVEFNIDATKTSLINSNNIKLYKCANSLCQISGSTALSLTGLTSLPEFAKKITVQATNISQSGNYNIGDYYRVVLKGGPNGLKAWNGNELTGLNFNSTGLGGGEECESNLYPWSEQSGVCTNTCLLTGNLCNTRYAECSNTISDSDTDYCNNTCYNTGNSHVVSCGDGLIGPTEECDDRNSNNNDGCSATCLWEGSSDRWGSVCGNGRVENGEQCDDGNRTASDGCSNVCLLESGRLAGSTTNVPVCGNSIKERGEDCDDGNKTTGDGCNSICLNEGSTVATTCNNGVLESGQADSFSWTYQAVDDPDVNINMNPCANGIWQVEVKRGNIEAKDIVICESGSLTAGLSETNVWGKIVAKLKSIISNFFGDKVLADSNDDCGDGYIIVPQNSTYFSDRMEYMSPSGHIFTYIKKNPWTPNKRYKINVYETDLDEIQTLRNSDEVTVRGACSIDDVKVEIWPRGEEKYDDNFFCVGDDCGRNTANKYDNDISAAWNIDASVDSENTADVNYDFPYLKVDDAVVADPGNSGNNHLYMAWAIDNRGYLIKSDSFEWAVAGLPKFDFSTSPFSSTDYSGDQWLNLNSARLTGVTDGRDLLNVTSTQGTISKNKKVNINIFLCNNPWPAPENFPYQDTVNNCTNVDCPNTNFSTQYCRDAGAVGEADDLPALTTNTVVYDDNPFKKEFLLQRTDGSNDAVGIRVVTNSNYYSPLVWYRENFDPNKQGNPQSIDVDSYDAIREGRTVYVNAVNIERPSDGSFRLYPNIYLISYSEGADSNTQNIYSQMAGFMKFNIGTLAGGGLPDTGTCQDNSSYNCFDDSDCQVVNAGACMSSKGKLTRDTRRLGDIQDINWLLNDYYNQKRCSNDRSTTCYSNAQCFGGGTCANYYPNLSAGTYIAGRSFSVWPSWQATLGNALGSALPVDPLNNGTSTDNFYRDGYGFDGCTGGYSSVTCWNDIDKKMQCPTGARVYAYLTPDNGVGQKINAFKEFSISNYTIIWNPFSWEDVRFMDYGNPLLSSVPNNINTLCR